MGLIELPLLQVIDNVRVFLPKCPLTTVRSRFSVDELQIVRGEAVHGQKRPKYENLIHTLQSDRIHVIFVFVSH